MKNDRQSMTERKGECFFTDKFYIHVDMANTNMNSRGPGSGDTRGLEGGRGKGV